MQMILVRPSCFINLYIYNIYIVTSGTSGFLPRHKLHQITLACDLRLIIITPSSIVFHFQSIQSVSHHTLCPHAPRLYLFASPTAYYIDEVMVYETP